MLAIRILLLSLALCFKVSVVHGVAHGTEHTFHFALSQGLFYQDHGPTWLRKNQGEAFGLGRYGHGSQDQKLARAFNGDLEYRYQPNRALQLRAHAQVRQSSPSRKVDTLALIDWELRWRKQIDFNHSWRVRFGQFFLPSSLENTERYWDSPYTLSYSAWNSWIGEEFRPIGADAAYRYDLDSGERISAALTLFGGNDSMGALLAYRGFSYGRLRTGLGEVLPLPDLASLAPGGLFAGQRDDGTKPFGPDLDGRLGYALRLQYLSDRLLLLAASVDNRGDAALHRGEYAWATKFTSIGASWFVSPALELLAQANKGRSYMGAGPGIDIDFYSAFVMASYRYQSVRLSYRYEQFGVDDRDLMDEDNHDFGRGHTLALIWHPADKASLGFELLHLASKRERSLRGNAQIRQFVVSDDDSLAVTALFKYHFN